MECYRRRRRRQLPESKTVLTPYTMCRRASNNKLIRWPSSWTDGLTAVSALRCCPICTSTSKHSFQTFMRDTVHWLSYLQRITFKLCLLMYRCLHGLAPPYLSWMCHPLSAVLGRSQLRSAEIHRLFAREYIPPSWVLVASNMCLLHGGIPARLYSMTWICHSVTSD